MKSLAILFVAVSGMAVGSATLIFVPTVISGAAAGWKRAAPADSWDAVPWSVLTRVATQNVDGRFERRFGETVSGLDGQQIKLKGFVIPLSSGDKHRHFLLSASPRSCFECWGAGAEGWVEVVSDTPVEDTYDQIVMRGRFSLVRDARELPYYRLTDAIPLPR